MAFRPLGANRGAQDRELVEWHKGGDPDAFAAIVRTYHRSLIGHAVRRLGEEQAAEDAVQEALLRAYRALPRFNGEYRLGPWLHRILENVCADEGNRRSRDSLLRASLEATAATAAGTAPETGPELTEAVAALPPQYQEALHLRFVEGMPYREVAAITGISEENARARVHRARAALKRVVAGVGFGLGAFFGLARRPPRALAEVTAFGRVSSTHVAASELVTQVVAAPDRMAVMSKFAAAVVAVALPVASVSLATAPSTTVRDRSSATQVSAAAPAGTHEEVPAAAPPTQASGTAQVIAVAVAPVAAEPESHQSAPQPESARVTAPPAPQPSGEEASATEQAREEPKHGRDPSAATSAQAPSSDDDNNSARLTRGLELAAPRIDQEGAPGRTDLSGGGTLSVSGVVLTGRFSFSITAPDRDNPTIEQRLSGSFISADTRLRFFGTLSSTERVDGVEVHRFEGTYRRYGAEIDGLPAKGEFTALYSTAADSGSQGLYLEVRQATRTATTS